MVISVISGSSIVLSQNVIYRARLEVVPPYGPAATEGAVSEELGKQGFADIHFYAKGELPNTWPDTERADDSGFMGKTYYLEGKFTLSNRTIPLSELGSKVNLRGMWVYLVPLPIPVPGVPPSVPIPGVPGLPPGTSLPPKTSGVADLTEKQKKIVVGWLVAAFAFAFTRSRMRHATKGHR